MEEPSNLLQLTYAKQDEEIREIKKRLTDFAKYFYNYKRNITIIYDKNILYVIHKDYLKILELGKAYVITDLAYNYEKNAVIFLTIEGALFAFFGNGKFTIPIKKDFKKVFLMDWIYGSPQTAHLFIAEGGGLHLYKYEDEKKYFKENKHISGKYHCFLHEPTSQLLIGFTFGDCQSANIFQFDSIKAKNWFRSGQLDINFGKDEVLTERIKRTKSFQLESSRSCKQIFCKTNPSEDYFIDCLRIYNICYICFYMSNQGKLRLTPLDQTQVHKPVVIKLPSDSLPIFNIIDNMLAVHLKNQKITFLYDVGPNSFQTLVSPYPMLHEDKSIGSEQIYQGQFVGRRVVLAEGRICKWKINLSVIFHFLKNEMLVFEFFNNRSNSKMEIIRWLRSNLFTIKPINLSKIWKFIFLKSQKGIYDESDIVTIIELYSNLFYTLSLDALVSKEELTNILLECIRQSYEFQIKLPEELQLLATELLLMTKKYEILTYLCHHNIIKAQNKIHKLIFQEYEKRGDELLLTLSIDLACHSSSPKEMLKLLFKTNRFKQGKKYLRNNSDKFEVLDMLEVTKYIGNVQKRREFVKFVRYFITLKFPSINTIYLDEAEKKLFE